MTDPLQQVLERLPGAKPTGSGWVARCPGHDDRRASLSISAGDDGRVLLHCFAGCKTEQVVTALGLTLSDLFPEPSPRPSRNGKPHGGSKPRTLATAEAAVAELARQLGRKPDKVWEYRNASGELVGLVLRWDAPAGKDIRPVARYPDGWRIGAMPTPRPLYRLPELLKAGPEQPIVVCEGEKAADAARSLGFVATTSSGGAQAATKTDWSPLRGRTVWVLPDNDTPGRKYAEDVARLATAAGAAEARIVELPGLGEGDDLADVVAADDWCGLPLGDAAGPADLVALIERLAQAAEPWQLEPAEPTAEALTYRPFPVDALPEPVRGFVVAAASALGCDPAYVALPLLVAIGAAVGNTRRLVLKCNWLVPPILWAVTIGESGTLKSPAFRLALRPVRERQRRAIERHAEAMRQYEAALARWERDFARWRRSKDATAEPPRKPEPPQAERLVVSDTTVEALAPVLLTNPRGLLLARDELAGWIGSFDRYAKTGGADLASWLSMYNAESIIIDRKTGTPRTLFVPQAAVAVCGTIQPGVLRRVMTARHRESGLLARLLLAYPPQRPKRWGEADIDPSLENEIVWLFDRLYELESETGDGGKPRPGLVRLSSEAKQVWITFFNEHGGELVNLTGDLASCWAKLEEAAARLALIVHFARWAGGESVNPDTLDERSMAAGIALTRWFKHEAKRVYAMLSETAEERDQRRLVEWIERRGGAATAREVQMGCRWLREPGVAEAALQELVAAGLGYWCDVSTTPQGGRPTRTFRLKEQPPCQRNPNFQAENRGFVDVDTVDGLKNTPTESGDDEIII